MENSKNGGYAGDINFGGRPRFINKNKNPGQAEDDAGFKKANQGTPALANTEGTGLNASATPFVAKMPDSKYLVIKIFNTLYCRQAKGERRRALR